MSNDTQSKAITVVRKRGVTLTLAFDICDSLILSDLLAF